MSVSYAQNGQCHVFWGDILAEVGCGKPKGFWSSDGGLKRPGRNSGFCIRAAAFGGRASCELLNTGKPDNPGGVEVTGSVETGLAGIAPAGDPKSGGG